MLSRNIKKALHHLPERLSSHCKRFNLDGIRLVIPLQGRTRADLLRTKVAAALHLIQNHAPKYHVRVQKFIPNILIFGAHAYKAVYISDLKLCDISRDFALLEKTSASHLAMTLVHEATHGYLGSKGITYDAPRRGQVERICIRAEIAFARKLPEPGELLAEAELTLSIDSEYWTDDAFFERDVETFENSGAPRWLVTRLVTYCRNRRIRRTKLQRPNSPPPSSPL